MKKNTSDILTEHQTNESEIGSREFDFVPADITSDNFDNLPDNIYEISTLKNASLPQGQGANSFKASSFEQVKSEILDLFIDTRQIILEENDEELQVLHKTIPLDAEEAELMLLEPLQLLDYIRQLFFQMVRIKTDSQKEYEEKKDLECLEYEPQLQKLEAEIREHIKIEQQMKLYAESLQEKLDDFEKGKGSSSKVDSSAVEELRAKLAAKDAEIEALKKNVRSKIDQIQALELQADLLPILKAKVKELERVVEFNRRSKSSAAFDPLSREVGEPKVQKKISPQQYSKPYLAVENVTDRKNSRSKRERTPETRNREDNFSIKEEVYRYLKDSKSSSQKLEAVNSELMRHSIYKQKSSSKDLHHPSTKNLGIPQLHQFSEERTERPTTSGKINSSSSTDKLVHAQLSNKRTSQVDQDRSLQKLKRESSYNEELFPKENHKIHGRNTYNEIKNIYGKTQEMKPRIIERGSSRRSSRENVRPPKAELNKKQGFENYQIPTPDQKNSNRRSQSVDSANRNNRALRSKHANQNEQDQLSEIYRANLPQDKYLEIPKL